MNTNGFSRQFYEKSNGGVWIESSFNMDNLTNDDKSSLVITWTRFQINGGWHELVGEKFEAESMEWTPVTNTDQIGAIKPLLLIKDKKQIRNT